MHGHTMGILAAISISVPMTFTSPATGAEVKLKAASATMTNLEFTQAYIRLFIDKVNENGKGVVTVTYLGGPEVTPPRKAASALKRGLFDILYAPGSYYVGQVPEANLLIGSNLPPGELRENGAWALLQQAWGRNIDARLLAWCCAETQFHLYLTEAPKRTPSGNIDLTGLKIRSTPVYRPLIEGLGGTPIEIKASEIFSGLERGLVQGFGWLPVGVTQLGLENVTKYRIDPPFFRTTNTLMMNLPKWKALPEAARDLIERTAREYEAQSIPWMAKYAKEDEAKLKSHGMKITTLEGAAAAEYLAIGYDRLWKRLSGMSYVVPFEKLKALMYDPGKS